MRQGGATAAHVSSTGICKTLATVRSATHDMSVVVVLTVVLPTALSADLVPTTLPESDVSAAGTRVRTAGVIREHVLLRGVQLEPTGPLGDQLFVRQGRVVGGTSNDTGVLIFRASTSTEPGHSDIVSLLSPA